MNFPVFSQLAGNFGFPETGWLETASSSEESCELRYGPRRPLQAEYARWLTGLPDSLRDTATAGALEALADIEPPRGYGRD